MTYTTEQKQQAIRAHIEAKRETDPNISFRAAWRRLRTQRPQLFESDRPIDSQAQGNDSNQKDLRSSVLKTLIQKVKALRKQFPDANTQTIFAHLRSHEPDLMIQASEAERPEPIRITRSPQDDDEAFIMLIAEDADQLLAECAAGLWDSDS
jgi:hypothetical protein